MEENKIYKSEDIIGWSENNDNVEWGETIKRDESENILGWEEPFLDVKRRYKRLSIKEQQQRDQQVSQIWLLFFELQNKFLKQQYLLIDYRNCPSFSSKESQLYSAWLLVLSSAMQTQTAMFE
jgi:hypothetical protein